MDVAEAADADEPGNVGEFHAAGPVTWDHGLTCGGSSGCENCPRIPDGASDEDPVDAL